MPTIKGTVQALQLQRQRGTVVIQPQSGNARQLSIYVDGGGATVVDIIDPTEMVRRNWLIGSLQKALVQNLAVTAEYTDTDFLVAVTLHAELPEPPAPVTAPPIIVSGQLPMRGKVARLSIGISTAKVVIRNTEDNSFFVYPLFFSSAYDPVNSAELGRRHHVIALLKKALSEGLDVTVTRRHELDAYIHGVTLHSTGD